MSENNEKALDSLDRIKKLHDFLKTEIFIVEPEKGEIKVEIRVYNDAPRSHEGSEVVFMGVGLVVIDNRESGSMKLNENIKTSRPFDHVGEYEKYNRGEWFTGTGGVRFPAYTADEKSHGQILFPKESVLYEITVSEDILPYLDIRVEGSISRKHLFRMSRPMLALKDLEMPLVIEAFQSLDKIDLYSPLLSLAESIPAFSPKTTLADIDAFRARVESAIKHVKEVFPELNRVFSAAPNQELRDLMKEHIGKYLTTTQTLGQQVLKTLSGSDMAAMKETSEKLKTHLETIEEVNRQKKKVMAYFEIET